jgi:hypothetical protein
MRLHSIALTSIATLLIRVTAVAGPAEPAADERPPPAAAEAEVDAEPTAGKRTMFWHLSPAAGATPELAGEVESALREYFGEHHGDVLMDGMTMDSLLLVEGNEKYLRCGTGAGCLSGLGRLAGMRYVITGEVALEQGRTITRLVLVDTRDEKVVNRAEAVSAGVPGRRHLEQLAVAMFEPERYRGSIELTSPVAGAEVLLDGRPVGVTPLVGPLADVRAGEHLVEVKKPGHQTFSRRVRVPLGDAVRVVAILPEVAYLAPRVRPFYADWPFWTALGVGLAGMATAAGLHADAAVLQDNADRLREQGLSKADSEQDRADARYLQAYVIYGIGGAGLLAAGVIALLDLVADEPAADEKEAALRFEVGPGPAGLGLSAGVRF